MQYKIGSFNMKNFGRNSQKDFEKIAEIIIEERLDIVALQEILSEGKGIKRMQEELEQCVKYNLCNWDFRCASPRESMDLDKISDMIVNDSRGECYAYLWNKKRFKLVEYSKLGNNRIFEPRIINSLANDVNVNCTFFARTPYYIRLQPLDGGFFELRLVDIHIYYGNESLSSVIKRKVEFDTLVQDIYPEISQKRYGQNRVAYTIALGDYNLNIFSPYVQTQAKNAYLSEVYTYSDGKETVQVLTVQDQLTTLKVPKKENDSDTGVGYANNYDHFTYSPELSQFRSVSYEAIDAVNKYCDGDFSYYREKISDHLPIVMSVEI